MGRHSKRSIAIRKGWETRKARTVNLQEKISKFQEKLGVGMNNVEGKNMNESLVSDVTEAQVEASAAPVQTPHVLIKKVNGRRGRPRGHRKVPTISSPALKIVDFDSLSSQAFTYDQVKELGVKAIYDGQSFRLLKQNGHVVLAS